MRTILCLLLLTVSVSAGEKPGVIITPKGDQYLITINGEKFGTYNTSKKYKKPFMLPVYGPGGVVMTRALNDPKDKDHVHHKGIWVSIDEINKIKFWAEAGLIVNKSVKAISGDEVGVLDVTNHWVDENGKAVVEENTIISIYPDRLMTYDIKFTAVNGPVEFEDTKEGLFGYRMPVSLQEKQTGSVVTAEGLKGTKEAWGKPAKWVDYFGKIDGEAVGVALFDHPDNFRPSRYHVRNYGLFSINPFGQKAYTGGKMPAQPLQLKKGESLRLRYGLYIHEGDTEEGGVKKEYEEFVKLMK